MAIRARVLQIAEYNHGSDTGLFLGRGIRAHTKGS